MVAKHLGATLVLPDIRGSKPGDERLGLFLYVHDIFGLLISFLDF